MNSDLFSFEIPDVIDPGSVKFVDHDAAQGEDDVHIAVRRSSRTERLHVTAFNFDQELAVRPPDALVQELRLNLENNPAPQCSAVIVIRVARR